MNEPGGDHDIANLCYTRIHTLREMRRNGAAGSTSNTRPAAIETSRPTGRTPTANSESRDDRSRRTGSGKLVRSRIDLDGRPTYRLEDNSGDAAVYVVPAPGVELEHYVGKKVEISGERFTRQGCLSHARRNHFGRNHSVKQASEQPEACCSDASTQSMIERNSLLLSKAQNTSW